jgi:alcohol-forming fatty acyl-CoA reductase
MTPRGRTFLLTGGTGFLGKVVLAELLRRKQELAVDRVYLLIRSRGQQGAAERFRREIAVSPCFSRLPDGWTDDVSVLEGALEEPGLALAPEQAELAHGVTHLIHTAASISFDLPLQSAARSNVTTALNVLEMARHCSRLERLVSVSTAYVTPHADNDTPIAESLSPLPAPAEELLASIENGTAVEAELLKRSGHPNTYTLTKSIAEHLLLSRRGSIPLAIVRPSIISASREQPFPGWIDSSSGFGAFVLLIGLGHLRAVVGHPHARLDLIPVDEVASRILAACGDGVVPAIQHAVAGAALSPTVSECGELIRDFFRVHPVARHPVINYLGPRDLRFRVADLVHHRIPIAVAAARTPKQRAKARSLAARLAYLNTVFPYFTSRSFAFHVSRPLEGTFEKAGYVRTVCLGVYRHILRRDDREWPLAGRRHAGHGGDSRWALSQPHGNMWIRFASWAVTKVLRRAVERVTVDVPSFESARRAAASGSALVIVPNHRSYLDFVLCSYLAFARPDLGIPIPHIAATMEFGRIPVLGRILAALHAFYLRRGTGREDPELTRRVHALIREGKTLEFFVEGQRSRSREFLPPKRGLLRCLQATGTPCTLLPVALTYDRVPEEAAFAAELSGEPKPRMRLGPLLSWVRAVWRGRIDLGRIHIACGEPVHLDAHCDVPEVSHLVIERLKAATAVTSYHLEAYLSHHEEDGLDAAGLRAAIEEQGGRVLESHLRPSADLHPRIAWTLRQHFAHYLDYAAAYEEDAGRPARAREREPVA